MKFVNLSDRPLKFDLGGVVYECDVANEVDIPEKVAFCVKLHGIPLTPSSEVEPVKAVPAVAELSLPVSDPEPKPVKPAKSK